jgi:hypothetical protein
MSENAPKFNKPGDDKAVIVDVNQGTDDEERMDFNERERLRLLVLVDY